MSEYQTIYQYQNVLLSDIGISIAPKTVLLALILALVIISPSLMIIDQKSCVSVL